MLFVMTICRNYSADATAFVVTYPIDSNPGNLQAALAWETAFIELAQTELSSMAAAAKLKLAFQAERYVRLSSSVIYEQKILWCALQQTGIHTKHDVYITPFLLYDMFVTCL